MKKNAFSFVLLFLISLIFAVCTSCGGGGGGATLYNQDDGPHNNGGGGSWGAGTTSGNSGSAGSNQGSSADEPLFNLFPYMSPPIESIDIFFYKNGVACEPLTGLNSSATQGMLPQFQIGDEIYGSAVIHLQDGSARNATLPHTEITLNTHLSFITEFTYRLQSSAEVIIGSGMFTTSTGINIAQYSASLPTPQLPQIIGYWKDTRTNVQYPAGDIIYPNAGDTILEPVFITPSGTPANPVIDQASEISASCSLVSGSKITITCTDTEATVYYTTDGTTPNSASQTLVSGKATVSSTTATSVTLKAVAIKDGLPSSVVSKTYTVLPIKAAPDAVGDIVFKDGKAVAYSSNLHLTDEMQTKFADEAVAYVFYKGTGCSNDGTTERMLEVGIRLTDEQKEWGITGANGTDEVIETINENCKNGSQNLSKIGTWLSAVGKTDDTSTETNYPAFYYAKNYGTRTGTTLTNWYLPSKAELAKIYEKQSDLNAICSLCNLTTNFSNNFRASSKSSTTNNVYFGQGSYNYPTAVYYICAVRQASSAADTLMTVTAPTITTSIPSGKKIVSGIKISISTPTGTTVYYTTNNSTPTSTGPYSHSLDSGKAEITATSDGNKTLKAVAIKNGISSNPVTATYSVKAKKAYASSDVGDIMFKDVSAVTYSSDLYLSDEQKSDAFAYIFYKGTECNDVTITAERKLGVGIKLGDEKAWCTSSAQAYNLSIEPIEDTKTGQGCLSTIGPYLSNQGRQNDTNTEANYPAFYYAQNYGIRNNLGSGFEASWYLPTKTELTKLFAKITELNAVCSLCGEQSFSGKWFWSCTQGTTANQAWEYAVNASNWSLQAKDNEHSVCAIMDFPD